ncbi:unnamed protein product, partial [Gongylonema pulchrum]|uniref:SH3 domain-containing protein n=1 Tax=Gongylonema pulchrum TaxID=637853 RepID=A0A183EUW7_9BILA
MFSRVLFTYTPSHEDELALREVGQIVAVISEVTEDPGWLLAEIDGKRGLIPDNFVEILRPTVATNAKPELPKMPPPPNVPVKPAKPPGLSSSAINRRATSSSVFAQMHSTLADAFTKPPKAFSSKSARNEEAPTVEGRPGDRLSHITTTRPKQPNKRPPSTIFIKRKSTESPPDDAMASLPEAGDAPLPTAAAAAAVPTPPLSNSSVQQQPLIIASPIKSTVRQPVSPLLKSSDSGEYVSRAEYNRLAQQLEELRTEITKF